MLPAPFAIGLKRPAIDRNTIERLHSPTAKTHSFPLPARVLTVSRSAPTRIYDSVFGIRRAVRLRSLDHLRACNGYEQGVVVGLKSGDVVFSLTISSDVLGATDGDRL